MWYNIVENEFVWQFMNHLKFIKHNHLSNISKNWYVTKIVKFIISFRTANMSCLQINNTNNEIDKNLENEISDWTILLRTIQFSIRASLLILLLDIIVLYMLYFTFGRAFVSLDLTLLFESGLLFVWTGISGSLGISFSAQKLRGEKMNESQLDSVKIKGATITALTYSVIAVFLFIYTIILGSL
ncbi:MAG: hypothetical protein ACXAC2_03520 [Candidatus Kariarchaeaceae archaeon]